VPCFLSIHNLWSFGCWSDSWIIDLGSLMLFPSLKIPGVHWLRNLQKAQVIQTSLCERSIKVDQCVALRLMAVIFSIFSLVVRYLKNVFIRKLTYTLKIFLKSNLRRRNYIQRIFVELMITFGCYIKILLIHRWKNREIYIYLQGSHQITGQHLLKSCKMDLALKWLAFFDLIKSTGD